MKFIKEQRVIVPGSEAQGVIVDATETVPGFPIYTLRWLTEAGETMTGTCGEGDLAKVNPSDAEIMQVAVDKAKYEDAIEDSVNALVKLRLADILARRKRKHERKRKR